jgi:hypothetical protein
MHRRAWVAAFLGAVSLGALGCGSTVVPDGDAGALDGAASDARGDAGITRCDDGASCDDGLFCNGVETCVSGACEPGTAIACDDHIACTDDACDEDLNACASDVRDRDGDGFGDASCVDAAGVALGQDCDDGDYNRFPMNAEVCDALGHDEDCDTTTLGDRDDDADGYVDALCCNVTLAGMRLCGDDCNDRAASSSPVGTEVCDGMDNDCDGMVDDGALETFYRDVDGDGFGGRTADATDPLPHALASCFLPAGYSFTATDCADRDSAIHPAAREACSLMGAPIDEDCDDLIDEGLQIGCYPDGDDDGWAAAGATLAMACRVDFRPDVGGCPPSFTNRDPSVGPDCDDADAGRSPGLTEICSTVLASVRDEDCSGAPLALERDDDADGYNECPDATGRPVDCDDADVRAHPGQTMTFGLPSPARTTGGTWDFDCDGDQEVQITGVSECSISSASCIGGIGNWQTRVPACGTNGQWITGCTNSLFSCSNVTMTRAQLCN